MASAPSLWMGKVPYMESVFSMMNGKYNVPLVHNFSVFRNIHPLINIDHDRSDPSLMSQQYGRIEI